MICEQEIRKHLSARAGDYFSDLLGCAVDVRLRSMRQRTNSTLYEFDLAGRNRAHSVLVKSPWPRNGRGVAGSEALSLADRPRLCGKPITEPKCRYEFAALSTIERYFAKSLDQRFAAVRTLDLLPDESALVMEKANASALNWQMLTASQFTRRRADLESLARVFQNAGAWLRQFHELPSLSHTGERGTTREEFIESIDLFTDYLSDGKPDPWNHIRDVITAAATDQLPKILPMGLNHGDYAPRNVLTEPSGRISIIDTIARWRAPIYEDLAHFINAIKISHPQVWTFGLAYKKPDLEMFETRFLNGYFGDTAVPRVQVRLFECQMLLERWAAITLRSRVATGWKRVAKETRRIVWESFLKRQLFKNMQYFQQCSNQPQDLNPIHAQTGASAVRLIQSEKEMHDGCTA